MALIVSELASNALLYTRSGHAHGWFALEVREADLAHVAITDLGGGGRPHIQVEGAGSELRERGRGLLEVSKLAITIGIHGSPETGHTVWADLTPHREEDALAGRRALLVH